MINFYRLKVNKLVLFLLVITYNFLIFANEHLENTAVSKSLDIKPWTIVIYMAADNDLELFSRRNLAQLMALGSNPLVNFLVQLDTKITGGKKITKRYFVEKNKLVITNPNQQGLDSGDPQTLIECVRWAHTYPSEYFMLILWNHGTGIIDIGKPRGISSSDLFIFNPLTNLIELDRSLAFLEYAKSLYGEPRGICFDDTTGNYLNNQKLEYALETITKTILNKKIDVIGFDACLMSMLEVANIVRPYAHYMIGSQEVELGTGWDYQLTFSTLIHAKITPSKLVSTMVASYETTYIKITPDYTQSAINLSFIEPLENNINQVAQLLLLALSNQHNQSVRDTIKMSRHSQLCTHFDEPAYLDMHHFYSNLFNNLHHFKLLPSLQTERLVAGLRQLLAEGMMLLKRSVINNAVGKNLKQAQGLSLYFPEHFLHPSYKRTKFAANNAWFKFLQVFLSL